MLWDRVGQASANGASVTEKKEDKMPQNGKQTVTGIGISIGLVNNPRRLPVLVGKQSLVIKKIRKYLQSNNH